ncbi:NAD-dependent epimerase/dehydratase family protein [Halorubellus sp. JP-L1]|uniref:NAD-dependent epimerase/dehydratase family protein n=1 Tax=Halorubellus sp. JP-L1 TaxID=2715753 RepID=UPI001408EE3E|nr:NAD-dependent epimerase/dehydratase family protein [Halorubellus sp. JP-L1]NHN40955.1 NAD-dependent epimerase/dehydratase family protein [Halorubellus sp. JP-L1]
MTILVTGGAGFIGSHLVEYLLVETGESVLVLDDFSTGREGSLPDSNRLELVDGDVCDQESIEDLVERSKSVYHLAAAVGVEKVVDEPLDSLRTNVEGTRYVLDAAAADGTPVFVASSSEVYGKSTAIPFGEDDDRVIGPTSVPRWGYANAKALDEFYALAHHDENDLPVVIGRFFNTVGPRQIGEYGMVIPTFVEQALDDDPITVYGDGTQTRTFMHVHETVEAVHELMNEPEANGRVFNIGSSDSVSINDLAQRVKNLTESESTIEHVPFEEAFDEDFEEPDHRQPDITRLRDTLGWTPDSDLDRILEDVIAERRDDVEVSS